MSVLADLYKEVRSCSTEVDYNALAPFGATSLAVLERWLPNTVTILNTFHCSKVALVGDVGQSQDLRLRSNTKSHTLTLPCKLIHINIFPNLGIQFNHSVSFMFKIQMVVMQN